MMVACLADTAPQRNSSDYVRRLIAANGVVMGKTRMHELAYGVTSINPVFGPVLNPYDVTKIPGGEAIIRAKLGFPSNITSWMTNGQNFVSQQGHLLCHEPTLAALHCSSMVQ